MSVSIPNFLSDHAESARVQTTLPRNVRGSRGNSMHICLFLFLSRRLFPFFCCVLMFRQQ